MAEKCEISIQQPKRCYVDTTGKYAQKIVEYVRNRLKGDAEQSQLTMDLAPFAGASNNRPVKFLCAIQVLAGGLYPYTKNSAFYVGIFLCPALPARHMILKICSFIIYLTVSPVLLGAECFSVGTVPPRAVDHDQTVSFAASRTFNHRQIVSFAVSRFTGGYLLFLFCRNGFFTFDCFGGNGFFNFLLSFFSSFLSPFLSFAVFLFFLLSFRFSFFPLFCGFFSHHLSFFLSFPLFVFPFSVFPSLFLPFSFFSRLWYLCRFVPDSVWQRFGFRPFFLFAGFGSVCRFSLLAKTSLFSALFWGPGRDGRTETPFFCKVFLPVHDRQTIPGSSRGLCRCSSAQFFCILLCPWCFLLHYFPLLPDISERIAFSVFFMLPRFIPFLRCEDAAGSAEAADILPNRELQPVNAGSVDCFE